MKKFLLLSLILLVAVSATELQYNPEFENLENGDSIDVDLHLHPPLDSVKNIINGNLTNENFSDTAYFKQRSVDSTALATTDWIFPYTRKWQVWDTATWTGRCGRGMYFYINDTTANDRDFRIYDDSTDLLLTVNSDRFTSPLKKFGFGSAVLKSWNTNYTVLQIGDGGAIWSFDNGSEGVDKNMLFSVNGYYDGSIRYIANDEYGDYLITNGIHSWRYGAPGAADAVVSASTLMQLTSTKLFVNVDTLDVQGVVIADSILTPDGWLSYIEDSFICTLSYNVDTIVIDTCFYTKVGNNVTLRFKEMQSPSDGAVAACGIKVNAMPLSIFNEGSGEYMPCWVSFHEDCSGGAYFIDNAIFGGRVMIFSKYDNSSISDDQSAGTPTGGTYLHYTKY